MKRTFQAAMAAAVLTVGGAGLQVSLAPPADAAPGPVLKACYSLRSMTTNDRLVNGPYRLTVFDGAADLRHSVVMNGPSGPEVYEAVSWTKFDPASTSNGSYLALYCNGDLSFRRSDGTLLWHSNTAGKGVVRLSLTSGGTLLLQNAKGEAVWQSASGRAAMPANSILPSNTRLLSSTYDVVGAVPQTLAMQTDGNLVYRDGKAVKWQSNTHVKGSYARLTTKAQLQVVSPAGKTMWSSAPTGTSYSVLDIVLASIWQYFPSQKFVWGLGAP